jgi:hypothetical protein
MYSVSEAFLESITKNGRLTRITGYIKPLKGSTITLTDDDIAVNPTITNQCVNRDEMTLGQAFQGQLKLSIYSTIDRYSIYGAEIGLTFGLNIDDEWEDVPLGVFYVSECERTANGVLKITALDAMDSFDRDIGGIQLSGSAYSILSLACRTCNIELGITESEVLELPNGNGVFGLDTNHNSKTWRDVVGDLSAVLGGFAFIDRSGRLSIRTFSNKETTTINENLRYKDKISDYQIKYTAVSCIKNGEYLFRGDTSGEVLNLGENDFVQLGLKDTVYGYLNSLLNVYRGFTYTPSEITWYGNPALDLGDLIKVTGYAAGSEIYIPLQKFTWKHRSAQTITAIGQNPNVAGAKSKSEREIENLRSSAEASAFTYYQYINAEPISIDSVIPKEVVNVRFVVAEPTTVTMWHEINLESFVPEGESQVVYVYYYYDDELQSYQPIHTYGESGKHILGTQFWVEANNDTTHTWKVKVAVSNGYAIIDPENVHALISGQKMAALSEKWNGLLELKDEIQPFTIPCNLNLNDEITDLELASPYQLDSFNDTYGPLSLDPRMTVEDAFDLKFQSPIYKRVTEDRVVRVTEDRKLRRTE